MAELTYTVDMRSIGKFKKGTRSNKRRAAYEFIAKRVVRYYRNRFISLSAMTGGSPQWPALAEKTVKTKLSLSRRGKISGNPRWILRRYNQLVNSFGYRVHDTGFIAGVLERLDYVYPSGKSLQEVALKHQKGTSKIPRGPIIVPLPPAIITAIKRDFYKMYTDIVKESNV